MRRKPWRRWWRLWRADLVNRMKKILITGSNGQLGRALTALLSAETAYELLRTDVGQDPETGIRPLDITDVAQVREMVAREKPDILVNCAAYTAVDKQEQDVDLSYRINAIGQRNLAIAAQESGVELVHVSTDYVFDGEGDRPYIEFDAPGPVSVYGRTKLAGERFVQEFSDRHYILRTAWLYGDGHNFVRTMLRLSDTHEEVSVVDDQHGSPTSAAELARIIAGLMGTGNYGLFHATCEGETDWASFTEEIFRVAGRSTRVRHVTSEEYGRMNPQSAKRPHNSRLDNYMLRLTGSGLLFADWHEALQQYLIQEGVCT